VKEKFKNFRTDEETLDMFENLKKQYNMSDGDLFKKIVFEIYNLKKETLVPISVFQETCEKKDKEIKTLYVKLGELQGELNIYKQQAFPKKSEKKWWQIWK
jgi:hypothetical protein